MIFCPRGERLFFLQALSIDAHGEDDRGEPYHHPANQEDYRIQWG